MYYMLDEIGEIENLESLENEEFEVENLRVSSLKVAQVLSLKVRMGIQLGSLKSRQRVARGSKAKDRWRTRRGSQSSPQARVRKFESLEFESLKTQGV